MDVNALILFLGGVAIGIYAIVIGGAMFFSVPLVQSLFPAITFGNVVGNIKVGSFLTVVGSTLSTHKHIAYKDNVRVAAIAFVGTILGASLISDLSQKWLFPAVCMAILLSFFAPRLARHITHKNFQVMAFFTGFYNGAFGAGIGLLLVALLRLKHPHDTEIASVKIQARFVELLLSITAVATHFLHGNLIAAICIPWSLGSIIGGFIGGLILKKVGHMSGHVQKSLLYASFALAFILSAYRAFF